MLNMKKELAPGKAILSDILINHIETLYHEGSTPTFAALADLCELCQAAVLNNFCYVSMGAYERSTLLKQLEFVIRLEEKDFKISDKSDDISSDEIINRSDEESIIIGHDENNIFVGNNGSADLLISQIYSLSLYQNPVLSNLVCPEVLENIDRGKYFLQKMAQLMMVLQLKKGVLQFEEKEAETEMNQALVEPLKIYEGMISHYINCITKYNTPFIGSIVEEPLINALYSRIPADIVIHSNAFNELVGKIEDQIAFGKKKEYFERYKLPPIGLMVLANAKKMDDLPKTINRIRDTFGKLRESIIALESREAELESNSFEEPRNFELIDHIKKQKNETYEEFYKYIDESRKLYDKFDVAFESYKFIKLLFGLKLTSALEALGKELSVSSRLKMMRIPGLFRTATFIENTHQNYIEHLIKKFFKVDPGKYLNQKTMLYLMVNRQQFYATETINDGIIDQDTFNIAGTDLPFSQLFLLLGTDENISSLLVPIEERNDKGAAS
jgi:hypothetical protein